MHLNIQDCCINTEDSKCLAVNRIALQSSVITIIVIAVYFLCAVADDWEDWEDESFEPKLEGGAAANGKQFETKGQAVLAGTKEPDASKFAGEDEEEDAPPTWEKNVPKPQQVQVGYRPLYALDRCMLVPSFLVTRVHNGCHL